MDKSMKIGRRGLLGAGGALAVLPLVAGTGAASARPGRSASDYTAVASGRRRLGALEVSAIGMGVQNTMRTFETTIPSRPEMHNLIRTAHDRGITFFDCAEVYGPHEAEIILGEAMQGIRDDIQITTKFGFDVDLDTGEWKGGLNSKPAHIRRAVEGSLRRLGTDRVDLLYQHRVDPEVPIEDVAGVVSDLMREGKVLHWGLSEMGLGTLRRAHAALPVAAVQNEYSMLWRGPENGVFATCEELGIGFVPFAPLGYGFLTGAVDMVTTFASGDFRSGTPRMEPENREPNMRFVDLVKSWAERKEAAPGQIALAWLMAQHDWIVPIPGTTQMPHLLENIGAANISFSASQLAELNAAVSAIEPRGARLPAAVQAWSDVEARRPD